MAEARSAHAWGAFCDEDDTPVALAGASAGPLAGLRFGVKDLFDIEGRRTGFGHPIWRDTHPPADRTAVAVQRLLDAGASVVGKTRCDELCYSLDGINVHYGTPVNPKAPDCLPGGSSSGSAVAVAAGLVDFALGSDTGGSVRVPASYCGILGIRPSHGAVSLDGAVPFAPDYDTAGWFATDAAVLERVGDALLEDSPTGAPVDPARIRLLQARDTFAHADPDAAARLASALAPLAERFASLERVELGVDGLDRWMQSFRVLQGAQIWQTHRAWLERLGPSFGAGIRERFAWVSTITPEMIAAAGAERARVVARMEALLEAEVVLVIPTTPGAAPRLDTPVAAREAWRNRALGLLCIAGHAGLPQVNLPIAELGGRPVGLSLVAARGRDRLLLSLACKLLPSRTERG
ncbi:MAG: amidase [Lautropia sp.]